MDIVITLVLGGIAGWLAGMIFKGGGLGLIGNIVVGIIGGFVGYWLFGKLGISLGDGWLGTILTSAAGAIVILFIINLFFKKR
ncbi:MAG: GlsB/YeaQ/YmgE family stress response membrane protein [Croceimicrobium sp.]|nr:GlsB/YeaQ/YmgE family stress response membrane protein [Bacteroidota bacterium]